MKSKEGSRSYKEPSLFFCGEKTEAFLLVPVKFRASHVNCRLTPVNFQAVPVKSDLTPVKKVLTPVNGKADAAALFCLI